MGRIRKTGHLLVAVSAGSAILVGTSLLLASQPAEKSRTLEIGAGTPHQSDAFSQARVRNAALDEAMIRTAHAEPADHAARTVAFANAPSSGDAGSYPEAGPQDPAPGAPTSYETFDLDDDRDPLTATEPDADPEVDAERDPWNRYVLKKGERLTKLWEREWDLPLATLYRLLDDATNARILNRVKPGQEVEWQVDDAGYLTRLRLWTDQARGHEWVRETGGWDFDRGEVENGRETSHLIISSTIDGNIASALAARSDLSQSAANALAVLLDRYLPVRRDARPGDKFTLLVEQETLIDEETPHSLKLLAFDYQGARIEVRAARHSNGRFYTPEGESLLPPFDRRPFAGNHRISSSFNPRRRHPVTGRIAPHHGTDFAMPTGTPVLAPADGRVTRVENHPYAGRFIEIEHGQGYSTRFLHLHRQLVRPGEEVKRGERIALSGNTGRSTGPHLHYEIQVNNRPKNPMRVGLPESDSLAGEELDQFKSVSGTLLARLDSGERNQQVAWTPFDEMTR